MAEDTKQAPPEETDGDAGAEPKGEEKKSSRKRRATRSAADKVAEERHKQGVELSTQLRHKRECPEEGHGLDDEGSRIEAYPATAPDGTRLLVVRCMECGESEVANDESEE